MSLYRARQAKLESREALVAQAGVDIEKHAEELKSRNQEALRSIAEERAQLDEAKKAFILEKAEAEEQQRLAAEELSRREGELTQKKVNLDSHKEELDAQERRMTGPTHRHESYLYFLYRARPKRTRKTSKKNEDLILRDSILLYISGKRAPTTTS